MTIEEIASLQCETAREINQDKISISTNSQASFVWQQTKTLGDVLSSNGGNRRKW